MYQNPSYIGNPGFLLIPMYSNNFTRIYLLSLAVYSRASQPQFNFPRIYLLFLAVYSRASRQKQTKYIGIQQIIAIPMYQNPSYIGNPSFLLIPMYSNNFPRIYPLSLAVYSRASGQKHTKYIGIHQLMAIPMYSNNFPRIYLHPLVVNSRAGQPQEWNI